MSDPTPPAKAVPLDALDAALINQLQRALPISERPFADAAVALGCDEATLLARVQALLAAGVLTRFGPLFQIERGGGQFVLAALAVPEARYADVAAQVNAQPEVAHNYRREHALNMWFVVAAESPAAASAACQRIEALTGLPVYAFPKEREFHVNLYLPARASSGAQAIGSAPVAPGQAHGASSNASGSASGESAAPATSGPSAPATALSAADRRLIAATQGGLPLVPRPYDAVGQPLGESGAQVRARLRDMQARGLLRRIAAVPNHYALGYVANGMTVWDVDDAQVDALGERMGAYPGVSHCYRRPRRLPVWRYNLFAMLHGHSRAEVEAQALALAALLGPACRAHDILYSSAILKKTGLRLRAAG